MVLNDLYTGVLDEILQLQCYQTKLFHQNAIQNDYCLEILLILIEKKKLMF